MKVVILCIKIGQLYHVELGVYYNGETVVYLLEMGTIHF